MVLIGRVRCGLDALQAGLSLKLRPDGRCEGGLHGDFEVAVSDRDLGQPALLEKPDELLYLFEGKPSGVSLLRVTGRTRPSRSGVFGSFGCLLHNARFYTPRRGKTDRRL